MHRSIAAPKIKYGAVFIFASINHAKILSSHSATKTVRQADKATTSRLFSLKAMIIAVMVPATAEYAEDVDDSMAGKVIAPRTAYGI